MSLIELSSREISLVGVDFSSNIKSLISEIKKQPLGKCFETRLRLLSKALRAKFPSFRSFLMFVFSPFSRDKTNIRKERWKFAVVLGGVLVMGALKPSPKPSFDTSNNDGLRKIFGIGESFRRSKEARIRGQHISYLVFKKVGAFSTSPHT